MTIQLIKLFAPHVVNLLMLGLLIYYRQRKRFREDRKTGLWPFLDANIVEIIFGLMLVPDVADLIMQLVP